MADAIEFLVFLDGLALIYLVVIIRSIIKNGFLYLVIDFSKG